MWRRALYFALRVQAGYMSPFQPLCVHDHEPTVMRDYARFDDGKNPDRVISRASVVVERTLRIVSDSRGYR